MYHIVEIEIIIVLQLNESVLSWEFSDTIIIKRKEKKDKKNKELFLGLFIKT